MPLYFLLWRMNHSRACAEVRGVPPTALGRLGGPAQGPAAVGRRGVPVPSVDHAAQDRQDLLDSARRVYSPLFCWIAAGPNSPIFDLEARTLSDQIKVINRPNSDWPNATHSHDYPTWYKLVGEEQKESYLKVKLPRHGHWRSFC